MQWELQPEQGVLCSQFALPSPPACSVQAHGCHPFAVQAPYMQQAWHKLPASLPALCAWLRNVLFNRGMEKWWYGFISQSYFTVSTLRYRELWRERKALA